MTSSQILVEKNIPCTMRDGTILYADIYRPNHNGPFPVLLTRIPYNKDLPMFSHRYIDTHRLVMNGYVVIIQDVRGRFASDGDFLPFVNEAEDGYDTVEWAASLPYSTGKVGMFGLSYYGFTQLLAASARPPHLECMVPAMTLNDQRNSLAFNNGPYELGLFETWTLESIVPDLVKRTYTEPDTYKKKMMTMAEFYNDIQNWYPYAPVNEWPPVQELGVADFFVQSLTKDLDDDDWRKTSITHKYESFDVPAYHIGGWYDALLPSTIDNFTEMKKNIEGSHGENKQKLIIGPWGHGDFGSVIGERSFGIHASEDWINYHEDLTDLHLRWFDYWLKGIETHITDEAPIKLFVMGINQWRDEQEWPLARTQYIPYYFHSNGRANTKDGDGRLAPEEPIHEPTDHFLYDPADPVPTHGGPTLYSGIQTMGPRDQRSIEERTDVLVYSSEGLEKSLEVTGPVKVYLWAKSDAPDTDFSAKLIDVCPDGTAYHLTEGIVRAKYRNGFTPEEPLSGEVTQYEIDLWATSYVFLPDHCVRVEISSSSFPRFDTNLNTGETMISSDTFQTAKQTIFHEQDYPSHILLPIIN
ncbi:CocE/NonD family hydrolase [Tuberibacillus sp. Marseille-P3662]|uniref:CocE/NonD family hydrolase n=1 Tax=Tuberibacillus sp. Marseille-P3662 TaxID=1965358 RepID=UPI000A1CDF5E|nr:CocE/NonD family hydrolase [Tuberibacillus sp. Marseille-P3662]